MAAPDSRLPPTECSLMSGCAVDERRKRVAAAAPGSSTGPPGAACRAPPGWCRRIEAIGAVSGPHTCQHTNVAGGWTAPRTSGPRILCAHEAAVQLRVAGRTHRHAGRAAGAKKLGVVSQREALGVPRTRVPHMNVLCPFQPYRSWNHPGWCVWAAGAPSTDS